MSVKRAVTGQAPHDSINTRDRKQKVGQFRQPGWDTAGRVGPGNEGLLTHWQKAWGKPDDAAPGRCGRRPGQQHTAPLPPTKAVRPATSASHDKRITLKSKYRSPSVA